MQVSCGAQGAAVEGEKGSSIMQAGDGVAVAVFAMKGMVSLSEWQY